MKTKNYFIAAIVAATTMFSACSKEDSNRTDNATGERAKITVKIATNAQSKATGLSTDDSDNAINNYVAFIFKGTGVLEEKIVSATAAEAHSTKVTTAAREVCVVANAPASLFSSVTTKTELLAVLGDLASSPGICSQRSNAGGNVWASGSVEITAASFSLNTISHEYEVTVPVIMTFVSAKINLTIDNQTTNQGAEGALTITKVAILNGVSQTKFFGSSLTPTTPTYYAGINESTFHIVPTGMYSVQSFMTDNYVLGANTYHYYCFENSSDTHPVILTLVASYGAQTRYFPVHFKISDAGVRVVRGNIYNVKITLKGSADPNDGIDQDPGNDDPTDPFISAKMTVQVSVSPWITNPDINKEF